MTARIYPQPIIYRVNGTMAETAPILAWIAEQAPSARVIFPGNDEYERQHTPRGYLNFSVSFENDTDEVNFKMFQSEGFEAGAQPESSEIYLPNGSVFLATKPMSFAMPRTGK